MRELRYLKERKTEKKHEAVVYFTEILNGFNAHARLHAEHIAR